MVGNSDQKNYHYMRAMEEVLTNEEYQYAYFKRNL
ncbi:MAG: hypothetical protein ACI9IT_001233 [Glaciecola sp.]|jgi:hypothetical protein